MMPTVPSPKTRLISPPTESIGIEELEDPLISLGLVGNRDEVVALMQSVDDDNEIEFDEFLLLVSRKKKKKGESGNKISTFFKGNSSCRETCSAHPQPLDMMDG